MLLRSKEEWNLWMRHLTFRMIMEEREAKEGYLRTKQCNLNKDLLCLVSENSLLQTYPIERDHLLPIRDSWIKPMIIAGLGSNLKSTIKINLTKFHKILICSKSLQEIINLWKDALVSQELNQGKIWVIIRIQAKIDFRIIVNSWRLCF